MRRLRALLVKEFIQMGRDRLTLAIMGLLPVIQLLIFGFAINTEVKHLPTVLYDQSVSAESRELVRGFQSAGYFDIRYGAGSFSEMNALIQGGRAKVGIAIPPDYQERLRSGRQAPVQVIVDASDSMSAASAISTAQMIGLVKSQQVLWGRLNPGASATADLPVDVRIRPWYNPDMVSSHYMVPGILAIVLSMTMMMITSMAIVRERERGTLEQLIVTPMRTWELMAGKILPYVVVGYVQLTLGLLIGIVIFRIPVKGSLLLFYGLTSLHILASLAWGILISSVADVLLRTHAEHPPFRVHVSAGGHAGLFPGHQQYPARDVLPPDQPGHPPEGRRHRRPVAAGGFPPGPARFLPRAEHPEVPQNHRLKGKWTRVPTIG